MIDLLGQRQQGQYAVAHNEENSCKGQEEVRSVEDNNDINS